MRFHTFAVVMVGLVALVAPTRVAAASPPSIVAYDSFGPGDQTQPFGVWMGTDPNLTRYWLVAHPFRVSTSGRLTSMTTSLSEWGGVNWIRMRIVTGTPDGLPDLGNVVWSEDFVNALSLAATEARSTFVPAHGPTLLTDTTYWLFPEVSREFVAPYHWAAAAPPTADQPTGYARYVQQSDGSVSLTLQSTDYLLGLRVEVLPEPAAVLPGAILLGMCRRRRGRRA